MNGGQERVSGQPMGQLGKYAILSELAQGLASRVFKAQDTETGVLAAVKILNPNMIANGEAVGRFMKEAKDLARLDHPNIAKVLDSGRIKDGRPFIVTEFVNGPTLERLIREKARLSLVKRVDLALQMCKALEAAHRQNIIHCDIKPANVMVDIQTQEIKIVDFGLARVLWEDVGHSWADGPAGTPRYMSPEQILGQGMDHRSDIYSAGVTLYHFFADQPPFDAPTNMQIMSKHATSAAAPIHEINPDLPQDLCDVIMRMIAKDPNDRYQRYEDLIEDLDAVKLVAMSRVRTPGKEDSIASYAGHVAMPLVGELQAPAGDPRRREGKPYEYKERSGKSQQPVDVKLNGLPPIEKAHSWIPLAVIVAGILVLLIMPVVRDKSAAGRKISLVARLTRIVAGFVNPSTQTEVDAERVQMQKNYERLKRMVDAVEIYLSRYGELPRSCSDLTSKKAVSARDAKDAWGNDFVVVPLVNTVFSAGADGEKNTTDDWEMTFKRRLVKSPARFVEMKEPEHQYSRQGRIE